MGAVKAMMMDLGAIGHLPVSSDEVAAWATATGGRTVATRTLPVEGHDGQTVMVLTIAAAEARRLAGDSRLDEETRGNLVWRMEVGGIDPHPGHCPICGGDNVTFTAEVQIDKSGRLVVVNADEPDGPNVARTAHCEDCDRTVPVTFPDWGREHQRMAIEQYHARETTAALSALYRQAIRAGLTGPAVEEAAARLAAAGWHVPRPVRMTMADRLRDCVETATTIWPARLAARQTVRVAATAATMARRLGLRRLAGRLAAWAYDLADHDPADDSWDTLHRHAPWVADAVEGGIRPGGDD